MELDSQVSIAWIIWIYLSGHVGDIRSFWLQVHSIQSRKCGGVEHCAQGFSVNVSVAQLETYAVTISVLEDRESIWDGEWFYGEFSKLVCPHSSLFGKLALFLHVGWLFVNQFWEEHFDRVFITNFITFGGVGVCPRYNISITTNATTTTTATTRYCTRVFTLLVCSESSPRDCLCFES